MGQPESWGALSASNRPPQKTLKKTKTKHKKQKSLELNWEIAAFFA